MGVRVENLKGFFGHGYYIGRGSSFGNPFRVSEFGREGCLARYKTWFFSELKKNGRVRNEIEYLVKYAQSHKELVLLCYCKPLACHGDIIKAEIERRLFQKM